jgi:uncharacterized membrane protein YkoI
MGLGEYGRYGPIDHQENVMKKLLAVALLVAMVPVANAATTTTTTKKHHHSTAKVSEETARAAALAQIPNGKVESHELEKEHGKLVYSFDIKAPGKSGVEEVNVDAMTGKVLNSHHETASGEKKEMAKEKQKVEQKAAQPESTKTKY